MKRYAVLSLENVVINIINAANQNLAEELTSSICIKITNETGIPNIGYIYSNGVFVAPEVGE